jgi:hypothetical protein
MTSSEVRAQRLVEVLRSGFSERRADHTRYTGFVAVGDGSEFAATLGANARLRLLPDGGEFPRNYSLADDAERLMIDYREGDIAVCVFDTPEGFAAAARRFPDPAMWEAV